MSGDQDPITECDQYWQLLQAASRSPLASSRASIRDLFPDRPGVYCVWEDHQLVYVGETSSLRHRMMDMQRTVNHTLRRSLGAARLASEEGFLPASSRRAFPSHIEEKLNQICTKLSVTSVEVLFGRKEIEEYIVHIAKPTFNRPSFRLSRCE